MAINVGCEFRDRGSIPIVCQITDADLGFSIQKNIWFYVQDNVESVFKRLKKHLITHF